MSNHHFDADAHAPVPFANAVVGLLLGLIVGIGVYDLVDVQTPTSEALLLFTIAASTVLFPVWRQVRYARRTRS
jgi:hypothetical protein